MLAAMLQWTVVPRVNSRVFFGIFLENHAFLSEIR